MSQLNREKESIMPRGLPAFAREHHECWTHATYPRCMIESIKTSDTAKACLLLAMTDPANRYIPFIIKYHSRMSEGIRTEPIPPNEEKDRLEEKEELLCTFHEVSQEAQL